MKAILIFFFLIFCIKANSQSLKISSITTSDPDTKELVKQAVGKNFDLMFYKDSVSVFISPLNQTVLLKSSGTDLYLHVDSDQYVKTTYLLTIYKSSDHISSIDMKITDLLHSGAITTGNIIAKPD